MYTAERDDGGACFGLLTPITFHQRVFVIVFVTCNFPACFRFRSQNQFLAVPSQYRILEPPAGPRALEGRHPLVPAVSSRRVDGAAAPERAVKVERALGAHFGPRVPTEMNPRREISIEDGV